jgi:hypothetical protein
VDSAEYRERNGKRRGMGKEEHPRAPLRGKEILEYLGESRLPQSTDCQAGQRDAHLDAGNYAVKVREKLLDDSGLGAALGHQLTHAGEAHRDKRELNGREETVQGHQHKHSDKPDQEHSAQSPPVGIVTADLGRESSPWKMTAESQQAKLFSGQSMLLAD